jgi:hypothetical protein
LERRADLEKETIDEVRKVLQAEFEKEWCRLRIPDCRLPIAELESIEGKNISI